jgi:hypothetical protein
MAFGANQPNGGGGSRRPPRPPPDAPPEQQPPPPRGGGGAPPSGTVDEARISQLALESLPKAEDFAAYIAFSQTELSNLATQIVAASQVDVDAFIADMNSWNKTMSVAEKALNTKSEDSTPSPTPGPPWPPLPGPTGDEVCRSMFDVNDLALRGRKSVLARQFYLPVVYPEVTFTDTQRWAFGQKLEYRQEWRHEGFTLGELISSLSLLPGEEVTLEVSSWQRTRTEIQEEESTETKKQLERELKLTDEVSATNEAMVNNGWTVSATGQVSYGPVSASANASANGSVEQRSQQAERHLTEETTKATNQVSLRRAVRMTQTAEAGSESRTTRRIRNPNTCHTVTFNFFQVVKLYNVQIRLLNDAPTVMLPSLFPAFYTSNPPRPVVIPYWHIESFNAPAVFLTRFFEVDRDLSEEIHGWGLRVRIDPGKAPAVAAVQYAEALVVAVRFLLRITDLQPLIPRLGALVASYVAGARAIRQRTAANYGVSQDRVLRGRSEQMTTPGIYADSLLGRCSACEAYAEGARYVEIMRQQREVERIHMETQLLDLERQRRVKLLEAKKLDPFEPAPTPGR